MTWAVASRGTVGSVSSPPGSVQAARARRRAAAAANAAANLKG